ncbi:MAG: hypothetical protein NVSMB17_08580 [Candidatus Dormibacteria bacterium]
MTMIRRTIVDLLAMLVGRPRRTLPSRLGERRDRQVSFFTTVDDRLDTRLLASDEMWR